MIDQGIRGSGGGKGGGRGGGGPSEAPNTLRSRARARIVDVLCEGEIGGLVDGARSIYLDETPLMADDGSYNFFGVEWHERKGFPDQDPIPGFSEAESETIVSAEVRHSAPVVRTVNEPDVDDVRIKVTVPSLYEVDTGSGNVRGTRVELDVYIKGADTGYTKAADIDIEGKTNSQYERAVRIRDIGQYGACPWDIKLERATADADGLNLQNQTIWASYTTIVNQRFSMPGVAAVGLQVDAEQFGAHIPTRSYEVWGYSRCRIPSNYDPVNRTYNGFWNGQWSYGYTNCPPWVWLEVATNERFGLPDFDISMVNKWRLYEIAQYCDQLVPDGYGGQEPRFTCNFYLQTQEEAYHVINALASAFLAMPYWSAGLLDLAQDKPVSASHLATPANVVNGEFHYSGTGLKARHSVAMVTWNDPSDGYRANIEVVEDPELIARFGWKKTDLLAVGCTSRGQAHRFGRWVLRSGRMEAETVTFKGGFDFADCVPGAVIKVQDPHYAMVQFGGRVKAGTTSSVELDRDVTLEAGQSYTLSVVLPDKTVSERPVSTGAGTVRTLTVAGGGFPQAPAPFAVWVLSASNVEPRPFRVLANMETAPNEYEITAVFQDVTKYAAIYEDIHFDPPPYSPPFGTIPPPTNLSVTVYGYDDGVNYLRGVLFSWTPSPDPRVMYYDCEVRAAAGEWQPLGQTQGASIDHRPVPEGAYTYRVRACGVGYSGWVSVDAVVGDPTGDVPDVTGLQVKGGGTEFAGRDCELEWATVAGTAFFPESRFAHYLLTVSGVDDAVVREERVRTEGFRYTYEMNRADFGAPRRTFRVSVKAVDVYGKESQTPAVVTVTNPAPSMAGYTPTLDAMYTGIAVRWESFQVQDPDLEKYEVRYGTVSPPTVLAGFAAQGADGFFIPIVKDSPTPTLYYVRVTPHDAFGSGAASAIASGVADPEDLLDTLVGSITESQLYQSLLEKINNPMVQDSNILRDMLLGIWPQPYNSGASYALGSYCSYNGDVYVCIQAFTQPPQRTPGNTAWWRPAGDHVQLFYDNLMIDDVQSAQISVLDGQIALRAFKVDVDNLDLRLTGAEAEIDGLEGAVALRAYQTQVTGLENSLYAVQSELALKPNAWTVKIDANGNVAGAGLIAYPVWSQHVTYSTDSYVLYASKVYRATQNVPKGTLPTNTTYWAETAVSKSEFIILADKFAVVKPGGTPGTPVVPFIVGDSPSGSSVVGINGQLIVNGSVSASSIKTHEIYLPYGQVTAKPHQNEYRVSASGLTAGGPTRLQNPDGSVIYNGGQSWNLSVYNCETGAWQNHFTYDIQNNASLVDNFINVIETWYKDAKFILVVYTAGNPLQNAISNQTFTSYLRWLGATNQFLNADKFKIRGAYILIGQAGLGEGNGLEWYKGDVASDPYATLQNVWFAVDRERRKIIPVTEPYKGFRPFNMEPPPAGTPGLWLQPDKMGYYDGGAWKVYIGSDGKFNFDGIGNNYVRWDGSVLDVRGKITADDITAGTLSVDRLTAGSIVTGKMAANSITQTAYQKVASVSNTTSMAECSLTTTGGPVALFGSVGKFTGSNLNNMTIYLKRGTSTVDQKSIFAVDGDAYPTTASGLVLLGLATIGAGSYTYTLTTSASVSATDICILAIELKR